MARTSSRKTIKKTPPPKTPEGQPIVNTKYICPCCGLAFGKRQNNFPISRSPLYQDTGFMPLCYECLEKTFTRYMLMLNDKAAAARRVCMKMDLYWDESAFYEVQQKNDGKPLMRQYISRVNTYRLASKTFDDTIQEEELAQIERARAKAEEEKLDAEDPDVLQEIIDDEVYISDEVKEFWGPGYSNSMYRDLENRLSFWKKRYPEGYRFDPGEDALLRQICSLEIDINNDRANGKSVEKNVNALNALIGSANLKPVQKKSDEADAEIDGTPLGVYIQMWEEKRPLPEIDDKYKDIHGLTKNIYTWFYGAAAKMVGLRNSYCRLFEKAMDQLRVARPEIDEEETDDAAIDEYFSSGSSENSG